MNIIKILVVDDEPQIRKLLQTGLGGYGFKVVAATNGHEAILMATQQSPDIVILDIALGEPPDGIDICRQIREWSQMPIIILSVLDGGKMKVEALRAGADDYLTKPFRMDELEARIHAILRRTAYLHPENNGPQEIHVGDLTIDIVNRRVLVEGELIHFTPKEYDLLRLLATNPGKVVTYDMLLHKIWGIESGRMDHYVRVFINQIRKKLKENPARNIRYIITEPSIGYRFVDIDSVDTD